MYLFDLNMSNIKSEALTQECSKRKIFSKILQNPLKHKKFAKFLRTPFENTNYSVEHLYSCKVLLVNCSFCNYIYHSHLRIFVKYVATFYGSEGHSLLKPFSKEKMKAKKVSNLNLLDIFATLIHVSGTK